MSDNIMETEIEISTATNKLGTVSEKRAKRLLDRVARGEPLADAAKAERMTVGEIRDVDSPVRHSLQQLIGTYFLPPEARRQMVRAGLNKVFLENVNSPDPGAQKVALDAAKQIGADPEVGLTTTETGGVIVNIEGLAGIFEQLKASRAPEVSLGRNEGAESTHDRRQREDRILEGEFTDLPVGGREPDAVSDVSRGSGPGGGAEDVPEGGD